MTAETRVGTLNFEDHTVGDRFKQLDFSWGGLGLLTNPVVRMDLRMGGERFGQYDTTADPGGIEVITNTAELFVFRITKKVIDIPAGTYRHSIKITSDIDQIDTWLSGTWTMVEEPTSNVD